MKTNFKFQIRNFILILLFFPLAGFAQNKNVISATRLFPKVDKIVEFEKALAAHAQKYHKGDHHWRVFKIESGPDAGGYHITEGPTNWTALDSRGDLGEEHMMDWHKNIAIHLKETPTHSYSVYQDSLSTIAVGNFTDKINIAHVYPKPGHFDDVELMIKKLRKNWQAEGVTVAVYVASSSGKPQYTIVTRYKNGLKEREVGYRKPFKTAYDANLGLGAYAQYQKDLADYIDSSWSELLTLRKDLSSK